MAVRIKNGWWWISVCLQKAFLHIYTFSLSLTIICQYNCKRTLNEYVKDWICYWCCRLQIFSHLFIIIFLCIWYMYVYMRVLIVFFLIIYYRLFHRPIRQQKQCWYQKKKNKEQRKSDQNILQNTITRLRLYRMIYNNHFHCHSKYYLCFLCLTVNLYFLLSNVNTKKKEIVNAIIFNSSVYR